MPKLSIPRARRGRYLLRAAVLSLALLILSGCSSTVIVEQPSDTAEPELTKYRATFIDLFDTLTTVVGYAERGGLQRDCNGSQGEPARVP